VGVTRSPQTTLCATHCCCCTHVMPLPTPPNTHTHIRAPFRNLHHPPTQTLLVTADCHSTAATAAIRGWKQDDQRPQFVPPLLLHTRHVITPHPTPDTHTRAPCRNLHHPPTPPYCYAHLLKLPQPCPLSWPPSSLLFLVNHPQLHGSSL
jgi:hypothetical protein